MQPILSLFKAVFHKYFPLKWLMEFLFILISHLLSINEKQFLNQAFFFGLNYDFDKEFQNIIREQCKFGIIQVLNYKNVK